MGTPGNRCRPECRIAGSVHRLSELPFGTLQVDQTVLERTTVDDSFTPIFTQDPVGIPRPDVRLSDHVTLNALTLLPGSVLKQLDSSLSYEPRLLRISEVA